MTVGLSAHFSSEAVNKVIAQNVPYRECLRTLLSDECFHFHDETYWFDFVAAGMEKSLKANFDLPMLLKRTRPDLNALRDMWSTATGYSGGDAPGWLSPILSKISPKSVKLPRIFSVPAFRCIVKDPVQRLPDTIDGGGLIGELAILEQYEPHRREDGERFEQIQTFVRNIVGDDSAKIRIPHDRNSISVRIGKNDLNLEALGSGIHQTILLAAMGTVVENSIICLEEPEIHLHPMFQRKLLRYLATKTSNQYFIATHSAHLLDCGISELRCSAFRVRLEDGATVVDRITSGTAQANVCRDLGYHASDLVQSNCVIWVEGPSDRIYLKHWVAAVDQQLMEGTHFSIMFYGGALLCYLSGKDDDGVEEFNEFVALRRLNRNAIILMDSDKKSSASELGEHKLRIVGEFKRDGLTWITAGRTIENYLSPESLKKAYLRSHPKSEKHFGSGRRFDSVTKKNVSYNKIRMAKVATNEPANLSVLDLKDRVAEVVAFIRNCNPDHIPSV